MSEEMYLPDYGKAIWKDLHGVVTQSWGSYVQKTTRQLERLRDLPGMEWIEWEVKQAEALETFENEVNKVINGVKRAFKEGKKSVFTLPVSSERLEENK